MVQIEKIEELTGGLKKYLDTNIQLVKHEMTAASSVIISYLFSSLLIGLAALFFLFFISLTTGFYLSALLDSTIYGFAIVAGFYFLIGLLLFLVRKSLLMKPIREKIIQNILEKK